MRLFFYAIIVVKEVPLPLFFDTEFDTIPLYVSIHAALMRVRPPLPAVHNPVERCIWRFAGLFYLE